MVDLTEKTDFQLCLYKVLSDILQNAIPHETDHKTVCVHVLTKSMLQALVSQFKTHIHNRI